MGDTRAELLQMVAAVAALPGVTAIGISGSLDSLPAAGESDIDAFVYCTEMPDAALRKGLPMDGLHVEMFSGGPWGVGDFSRTCGVETFWMYFTEADAQRSLEETLAGMHPGRVGTYYPIGRCATLLGMTALVDDAGFIAAMKAQLTPYPQALSDKLASHHLAALSDVEDLERGVLRQDVLFYHYALDEALDHFLQAIFAMNHVYFPSRKRSMEHISRFAKKPVDCGKRLLQVVRCGGDAELLAESYAHWRELTAELLRLHRG